MKSASGVTQTAQLMDLHRFWDGVIISSQNLTRLRNEATALRNRQEFQRSQLAELASIGFESWAKESFEIAAKFAYRNDGRIGIPKDGNIDCSVVSRAPVLPAGYVSKRSESTIKHSLSFFLAAGDQPTFPYIKYLIIFPDRHEDFWFSFSRSQKRRGRQTDPFFKRPSFRPRCATSRSRPSH